MLAPEGSNKRFSLMRAAHYVIPQTITRFRAVDSKALEKAEEEKVAAQEGARAEALGLDAEEAARMEAEAARAAARRAKLNWKKVRVIKNEVVLTKRWHKDMDRKWKRLRFSCRGGHTLMAGMFYRGVGGFTRAQTVQFLFSSLALELVVLSMTYTPGDRWMLPTPACSTTTVNATNATNTTDTDGTFLTSLVGGDDDGGGDGGLATSAARVLLDAGAVPVHAVAAAAVAVHGRYLQARGGGAGISSGGGGISGGGTGGTSGGSSKGGGGGKDGGGGGTAKAEDIGAPMVVINPIKVVVSAAVSAAICIPAMLISALLFNPELLWAILVWWATLPCRGVRALARCCRRCCARRRSRPPGDADAHPGGGGGEGGDDGEVSSPTNATAGFGGGRAELKGAIRTVQVMQPPRKPGTRAVKPRGAADGVERACAEADGHQRRRGRRLRRRSAGGDAPKGKLGFEPRELGGARAPRASRRRDRRRLSVSDDGTSNDDVQFSYASLNEMLLKRSLTHALQKKQWRCAAIIALGWLINSGRCTRR